ncbi:MAG: hypothetical protein ABIZ34_09005, partial [Candidatus Limnocylindrales bacterium]
MPQNDVQRHTGVVTRRSTSGDQRRGQGARRPTDPRAGWMLLVGAGIVATLGIAWILGVGSSPRAVTADVSPTLTASMSGPTGPLTPRPTLATPATTPAVEPTRTAPPTPLPTIVPTPTPSPTPSRSPLPSRTPAPSTEPTAKPELGFAIDFP